MAGIASLDDGFFLTHDPTFRHILKQAYEVILSLPPSSAVPSDVAEAFHRQVARDIAPFNTTGLADPAKAVCIRSRKDSIPEVRLAAVRRTARAARPRGSQNRG